MKKGNILLLMVGMLLLFGCEKKLDENKTLDFIQNDLIHLINQEELILSKTENKNWQLVYHLDQDEMLIKDDQFSFIQVDNQCFYEQGDVHISYPKSIHAMESLIDHQDIPMIFGFEEGFKKAKIQTIRYNSKEKYFEVDFNFHSVKYFV